ncbi:hypothetical protein C0Q70_13593 [Pomacea canaliculata]|uniref:DUF4200 domain-containing protein n=1 Tax=Pomacea canaliculata TaxID=400727 RepID=A0A2T7NXM9_POMCA|nr:hypothetical protein C0Q70_13593 [Pomacea canaliculata]
MESLQQRREELERKEYQLKESLLKFDKFLKENDSKRARAVKKANDERELKRQKDKEIDRLEEEYKALTNQKNKLQKKLENYTGFHLYMEKVLEAGEEFHELRDIIARWDTLTATHQDLLERDQENQEVIEKQRQNLMRYMEEKDNEILGYNNKLSGLQTQLDAAQSESVKWESMWNHIKNTAAKKTLVLGRIKMSTHNLYQLVKKHQKQAEAAEETIEQLTQGMGLRLSYHRVHRVIILPLRVILGVELLLGWESPGSGVALCLASVAGPPLLDVDSGH